MGSLILTGMLPRRQLMLPTRLGSITGCFQRWVFPTVVTRVSDSLTLISVSPNGESATCHRYVLIAINSGAQLVSDSSLGGDVLSR